MSTLVALSSCEAYEKAGLNNPPRQTWLQDIPKDWNYKFFHGRGATPKDDVVIVDCNDEYYDLTSKTKLKIRWALEHGYDYIFMAFPDTYACGSRLASCGYHNYDYYGNFYQHPGGNPYCQGGCGYFLSRKAMEILDKETSNYPNEDCWVGDVLSKHIFSLRFMNNGNFTYCGPGPMKGNSSITNHLSTQPGGYVGSNMLREHEAWLRSHDS